MLKIKNLLFLLILFAFSCKEDNLHTVVKGKAFLRADASMLDSIEVRLYSTSLEQRVVTDSDGSYSISFDAETPGNYTIYPYRYDAVKNKTYVHEELITPFKSINVEVGKTQTIDLPMVTY